MTKKNSLQLSINWQIHCHERRKNYCYVGQNVQLKSNLVVHFWNCMVIRQRCWHTGTMQSTRACPPGKFLPNELSEIKSETTFNCLSLNWMHIHNIMHFTVIRATYFCNICATIDYVCTGTYVYITYYLHILHTLFKNKLMLCYFLKPGAVQIFYVGVNQQHCLE